MYRGMRPPPGNSARYYELLEVTRDVSPEDLKKSYKKLAFVNHPDKGGDPEKFKEIANAFAVLTDPDQRQLYDTYGEEGLKEGMGGGYERRDDKFAEDLLRQLFGEAVGRSPMNDFFGRGGVRRERKGENVVQRLRVPLEDLYTGSSRKLSITRQIICASCRGTGSKSQRKATCLGCSGSGVKVVRIHITQGIAQQVQSVCTQCRGTGEAIQIQDLCPRCSGVKVVMETKTLEVPIEKGMQGNQKIVINGAANESPGTLAGDVVVIVQEADHPRFKRKGADLFVEHELSILEALTGFSFVFTHLDGRRLLVKADMGSVTKPGDSKVIRGEGMPRNSHSLQKGSLFIQFKVGFPAPGSMTPQQCSMLEIVFAQQRRPVALEDFAVCEEVLLENVEIEKEGRRHAEESRDEGFGDHRSRCSQQ